VEDLHRHCQNLNGLVSLDTVALGRQILKEVEEHRRQYEQHRKEEHRKQVIAWLTPKGTLPSDVFTHHIRHPEAGTGQWFLDCEEFRSWVAGENESIFCHGIPGAGKSMMETIVNQHLREKFGNDPDIGIAYYYYSYGRPEEQKAASVLSSLFVQLIQRLLELPGFIQDIYKPDNPCLLDEDISKALDTVVRNYSQVFIVIDALDECRSSREREVSCYQRSRPCGPAPRSTF